MIATPARAHPRTAIGPVLSPAPPPPQAALKLTVGAGTGAGGLPEVGPGPATAPTAAAWGSTEAVGRLEGRLEGRHEGRAEGARLRFVDREVGAVVLRYVGSSVPSSVASSQPPVGLMVLREEGLREGGVSSSLSRGVVGRPLGARVGLADEEGLLVGRRVLCVGA
jgi:hypothetical protein